MTNAMDINSFSTLYKDKQGRQGYQGAEHGTLYEVRWNQKKESKAIAVRAFKEACQRATSRFGRAWRDLKDSCLEDACDTISTIKAIKMKLGRGVNTNSTKLWLAKLGSCELMHCSKRIWVRIDDASILRGGIGSIQHNQSRQA